MSIKLDIGKFKDMLIAERDRIELERRANLEDISEMSPELADYDNHPGEAATDTFERTKDYAIDENYKDILERIEDALRKINDGTYGQCDRCDKQINPERLKAIPYATLCIDCQEIVERR